MMRNQIRISVNSYCATLAASVWKSWRSEQPGHTTNSPPAPLNPLYPSFISHHNVPYKHSAHLPSTPALLYFN